MIADQKLLAEKISASKADIALAEAELSKLLEGVGARRAEKTTITSALRAAIDRLRTARLELEDLDRLLQKND